MALPNSAGAASLQIRIGGISIAIEGDVPEGGGDSARAYAPFLWQGRPDIRLCLHRGSFPGIAGEKVFDCPPIWTLYRWNGGVFFDIFRGMPGLRRILALSPSGQCADLYFSAASGSRHRDPFFGPTMELLMVDALARARGILLHGCGVASGRRGVLFVGESGSGKSTLAGLWCREPGVRVLSDDRIIIRKEGKGFRMHGTPWHGTAGFGCPTSVPLNRILFLRHGRSNTVTEVPELTAAARLLACSFPPYWDASGMSFGLELLHALVMQHPCGAFSFRPDRSAVACLKAEGHAFCVQKRTPDPPNRRDQVLG